MWMPSKCNLVFSDAPRPFGDQLHPIQQSQKALLQPSKGGRKSNFHLTYLLAQVSGHRSTTPLLVSLSQRGSTQVSLSPGWRFDTFRLADGVQPVDLLSRSGSTQVGPEPNQDLWAARRTWLLYGSTCIRRRRIW